MCDDRKWRRRRDKKKETLPVEVSLGPAAMQQSLHPVQRGSAC